MTIREDKPTGPGVTAERRRLRARRERPRLTGVQREAWRLAPCRCGHMEGSHRGRWTFNALTASRVRLTRCDDCPADENSAWHPYRPPD